MLKMTLYYGSFRERESSKVDLFTPIQFMSVPDHVRLTIIGGGPGGLTASIYAARAGLNPVTFLGVETSS